MSSRQINSLSDLNSFAYRLVRGLKGGDIMALSGELGSGKTTLTQAAAKALGVTGRVLSPTFVVFKIYPVRRATVKQFCHIDLYRLRDFSSPHGFEEHLGRPDTICFIEWAERLKDKLPPGTIRIKIQINPNGSRTITKTRQ